MVFDIKAKSKRTFRKLLCFCKEINGSIGLFGMVDEKKNTMNITRGTHGKGAVCLAGKKMILLCAISKLVERCKRIVRLYDNAKIKLPRNFCVILLDGLNEKQFSRVEDVLQKHYHYGIDIILATDCIQGNRLFFSECNTDASKDVSQLFENNF